MKCEEPDCDNEATVHCHFYDVDEDEEYQYNYCFNCAVKNGFCGVCGCFWAGIDSFEFSRLEGICENCVGEFED